MFLSGLEDGSEGKSEKDNSVYVFYAKQATPLWWVGGLVVVITM